VAFSAISRSITQNGTQKRIYSGPQFYKDSSGSYRDVSTASIDSSSSIGNIKLVSTTPFSMGTRTDANNTKFIGFRPDENQSGSEQLEFTISTVLIDGANVSIDLTQQEVTDEHIDFVSMRILKNKNGYRQLFKVPESSISNSFRIEYVLNTRGLVVSEVDGEYHFSNQSGVYRFKIGKPCVMDSSCNILNIDVSHDLSLESEGVYRYIKHVDSFDFTQFDDVAYLDATTQYNDYDGAPRFLASTPSMTWSAVRGAINGNTINGGSSSSYTESIVADGSSSFGNITYSCRRFFLEFDTSSISNITSACYGEYHHNGWGTHIIVKSTQSGSVAFTDYNQLDYTTPYSSPHVIAGVWSGGYNKTALNNTAVSDINSGSTFNIACIDYTYDYLNADPGTGFGISSIRRSYFNEYTGTSRDPYILVDTPIYGDMISASNF